MFKKKIKTINLALQGGGSHGAFTWGVLDRLLEEDGKLAFEGISGASAGALNGAIMLQGFERDGAKGAREALETFWTRIGGLNVFNMGTRTPFNKFLGKWNHQFAPGNLFGMMGRMFSPYQTNPMNINPLRDILSELIDIRTMKRSAAFKLFVSATCIQTGKIRIFPRNEITIDVLMASACLPFSFQAVEIDGLSYWDGGYVGNPPLLPLMRTCRSSDIVLVPLLPFTCDGTPSTTNDIVNRLNEIMFNAPLLADMRTIALTQELIDNDMLKASGRERLKRIFVHVIRDEKGLASVGVGSRMDTEMDFLLHLKKMGRKAAASWLKANWGLLNEKSSVDVKKMFLD